MTNQELPKGISQYFRGRPELAESSSFSAFYSARNSSWECFLQNRALTGQEPKAFAITLDTMLGYPETRQRDLDDLKKHAKECASILYGLEAESVIIDRAYLMTNGSSLPLRVDLSAANKIMTEQTMYVKAFDFVRLFGLELYRIIAGADDYRFFFNRGIIVEDGQKGKHEFELNWNPNSCENYKREKAMMNVVSFYMGLHDLAKKDNYVIYPNGRTRVIDFDVMEVYSDDDIAAIKVQTARELGIGNEEYEKMHEEERQMLQTRLLQKKETILRLIRAFGCLDRDMKRITDYAEKNMISLL
jgi:hypothetical protein